MSFNALIYLLLVTSLAYVVYMAAILDLSETSTILKYLNAYHCIGRSATNADTVISAPEVSRVHAVIEWFQQQWFIRDVSHNGTWVNNEKLLKDTTRKLELGDIVTFASGETYGMKVADLAPPQNMLLALDERAQQTSQAPIILTDYNLLPNEDKPEIVLFYAQCKGQWYKEFIADANGHAYPVNDLDTLRFSEQNWQINLNSQSVQTLQLSKPKLLASQIKYRFNLSLDEENTELHITTLDEQHSLSNNAHHYLTLNLARYRDSDARKGLAECDQGWVLPEILAQELGYDISLFNTHVCRAKKQFRQILGGACDGDALIERQGRRIRFAGSFFRIYKGNELIVNRGQDKVSLTVLHG